MYALEIILLFIGLIISSLSLYKGFGKRDKNKITKIIGFEIKKVHTFLGFSYLLLFLFSIIVFITRYDKQNESSIKQEFIFENVREVKRKVVNLDSLINIQIDSISSLLNTTKKSAYKLNELDSLTQLSFEERNQAITEFRETSSTILKNIDNDIKLTERANRLSEGLINFHLGLNAFGLLWPKWVGKGRYELNIVNIGSNTLKNVRVTIRDQTKEIMCFDDYGEISISSKDNSLLTKCIDSTKTYYVIGDLYPNRYSNFESLFTQGPINSKYRIPWTINHDTSNGIKVVTIETKNNQNNFWLQIEINSNGQPQLTQLLNIYDARHSNGENKLYTELSIYNHTLFQYKAPFYPIDGMQSLGPYKKY